MHAFVYIFEANTRNVCVEKTFQLSWLIIILFSLSHLFLSHSGTVQYSTRHIMPLIHNNNIDFNMKVLTESPSGFQNTKSLLFTQLNFIMPLNSMDRRFTFKREWEKALPLWRTKNQVHDFKNSWTSTNSFDISSPTTMNSFHLHDMLFRLCEQFSPRGFLD